MAMSLQLPVQLKTVNYIQASSRVRCRQTRGRVVQVFAEESMTDAYARIRESRKRAAMERNNPGSSKPKRNGLGILGSLDFQEDIAEDRGLLAKAKRLRKGEKMSSDQYKALGRKVGGTTGGFFGESVDLKGKYADKGYVQGDGVSNSSTGSLIGAAVALVGVLATLVAVASL
mmetsp:Transcript_7502/g.10160  ORF Transcript_7502/g.10160 Transcript_7502/m.10160 type:complete len:173 (-) Transcript_7502:193-711(-)|eukprot:CAMPEP_0196585024 /NCGR_PEP_ID=MMETSP1081-20130531/49342_1 /TAXON_ID=36882 /ORGANISM="Pyramimonas amylifera, Strain CCMP720" /LENGTH=172 /DNA_ID=CAMNT_0041906433 /DNA_START=82 /DNA_END=600 /DNA_ORIENTATION=-